MASHESDLFYLRYYTGHSGQYGHEFLRFEYSHGRLRYTNKSNYRNDILIRRDMWLGPLVVKELKRIVESSGITKGDDTKWPKKNIVGKQELEVRIGNDHIAFVTAKVGSLVDIQDSDDPEGLRVFYYLVEDLKSLMFSLVSLHFKTSYIGHDPFYLRYYTGHSGKFGHEFLEFEYSNGHLRYTNNSDNQNDSLIRRDMWIGPLMIKELKRIVESSEIIKNVQDSPRMEDDSNWPKKNTAGKQELEVCIGNDHIAFETAKIRSLVDIQNSDDPEGLRIFYYLVQDLRCLIFSLISLHFRIKPI